MDSDLFDYFRKGEGARFKLERLSVTQRRLVSMKFVLAMISEVEKVRVTRHEDQVLKDGRRISILLFELDIGSFVFGIPQYTDSALVLIDLEIGGTEIIAAIEVIHLRHAQLFRCLAHRIEDRP